MSYPSQWAAAGLGPQVGAVSSQADLIQNQAMFNQFGQNSHLRQPAPQMQMPLNQATPNPNLQAVGSAYSPNGNGGYSLYYQPLVNPYGAQPGPAQPRQTPGYCFPTSITQNPTALAAALRGAALLSPPPTYQPPANIPTQQQLTPLQYFSAAQANGFQLAAFPGASAASFSHAPGLTGQQHQQSGALQTPQFRSYDSLKHFGALPQPPNHKRNKSMTTSKTNLYICGLSETDTDETVRALVEDVVRPKSCKAMLLNGKCKGSGFIDCATEEDAVKALNHLNELAKNTGKKLSVKYALENEKDLLNVYVRNLPKTGFTKETLEGLFRPYGQVTSVKLLETDGVYTGIGFVRFATAEQAQRAVESMNEQRYILPSADGDTQNGGGKPICCKLADKADPKRRTGGMPPSASPGGGNPRPPKPHHNVHHNHHPHQAVQHPLIPSDYHIQQQQQHQALQNPLLYPTDSLLSNGPNAMMAAAAAAAAMCSPQYTTNARPLPHDTQRPVTSSAVALLDMPATAQSPPTADMLTNGHSAGPALDSRYTAQLAAAAVAAAAAVSNSPALYPSSNPSVGQFSRASQPTVNTTYSTAYNGQYAQHHQQQHQQYATNPTDLVAEQLQSLSLLARQNVTPLYQDWSNTPSPYITPTAQVIPTPVPTSPYNNTQAVIDQAVTPALDQGNNQVGVHQLESEPSQSQLGGEEALVATTPSTTSA